LREGGWRARVWTTRAHAIPALCRRKPLHEKVFVPRESVLSEMLQRTGDQSFRAIYHMMLAGLLWLGVRVLLADYKDQGTLVDFGLLTWAFGRADVVMRAWCIMFVVHFTPVQLVQWMARKPNSWRRFYQVAAVHLTLQVAVYTFATWTCLSARLPPASGLIVMCEAARFSMKMHAYLREKLVHGLRYERDAAAAAAASAAAVSFDTGLDGFGTVRASMDWNAEDGGSGGSMGVKTPSRPSPPAAIGHGAHAVGGGSVTDDNRFVAPHPRAPLPRSPIATLPHVPLGVASPGPAGRVAAPSGASSEETEAALGATPHSAPVDGTAAGGAVGSDRTADDGASSLPATPMMSPPPSRAEPATPASASSAAAAAAALAARSVGFTPINAMATTPLAPLQPSIWDDAAEPPVDRAATPTASASGKAAFLDAVESFANHIPAYAAKTGTTLQSLQASQPHITIGSANEEVGRYICACQPGCVFRHADHPHPATLTPPCARRFLLLPHAGVSGRLPN